MKKLRYTLSAFCAAAMLLTGCITEVPDETTLSPEPVPTVAETTLPPVTEPETTAPELLPEIDQKIPGIVVPLGKTEKADQLRLYHTGENWWAAFANPGDNYVFVASSPEELQQGLEQRNIEPLDLKAYDAAFFADNRLALIPRVSTSGSALFRYRLAATADGAEITVTAQAPEIGTCDMADWLIAVPVPVDLYGADSVIAVNPAGTSFLPGATRK